MTFDIYPAIDLRGGRVVRLQYGDPDKETIFSDDPVATAQKWIDAGTQWLHVVNLDGAFNEGGAANWAVLPQLTALGAQVQFGGGVRTLDDVERVLETGANRVILGTAAIENPALVGQAVAHFGAAHVAVGIDVRDGRVQTRGWQTDTAVSPIDLGYTTAELAQTTGLKVIASGGVASLADVSRCHAVAKKGVIGVITGRALYEGKIDLNQALAIIS